MESLFSHIVGFFQASYDVLKVFTCIVAAFLLLSGLDDVFLDFYYWYHYLFRRKTLNRHTALPRSDLNSRAEKPIAIFIPVWKEHDVIDRMLTRTCASVKYGNYTIFVGVYPNDLETMRKVLRMARVYDRIHPVVAGHQGPSTKAENLNEIHQGMLRWENATGIRYDIIVLHDAEDVIHPLSLKVFNRFVPEFDMVQLPVFPLEMQHKDVVHWTYCDEFAENHTKDLIARHILTGFIPSAGVGTGYNRWLIEFVGTSFARNLFKGASLTEDYDIALRLALGEAKLLYLYRPFGLDIATWAFFPHTFASAVRQKTRWLIGICLQSWKNYGWIGSIRFRFTLYRDRKAVITNIVNVLAYVVLIYVLLYELAERGLAQFGTLKPIVTPGTFLWYLVVVDTGLMLWRFLHRYLTVSRIYGSVPGIFSILRYPIGNVINFWAAARALTKYSLSRVNGTRIAWDKTMHKYPSVHEHNPPV